MRRIHRPLKHDGSRLDEAVSAKPGTRLLHEILDVEMLGDLINDPLSKLALSRCIKRAPPQIVGGFTLVVAFGIGPHRPRQRRERRQVKLPTEIA